MSGGACLGELISPGQAGLNGPGDIIQRADGRIFVASLDNDSVIALDPGGSPLVLIAPGSNGLNVPDGLAIAPDGSLLVSNTFGSSSAGDILRYDADIGVFLDVLVANAGGLSTPRSIVFVPEPPEPCYADCDENGILNIIDYICFGDAYAVGCP